jgi:hypothetical protein
MTLRKSHKFGFATLALALTTSMASASALAEVIDFSNSGSSSVQGSPSYTDTTQAAAGSTPNNVSNTGSSAVGIGSPLVANHMMVSANTPGASPTDFSSAGSSAVTSSYRHSTPRASGPLLATR